MTPTKFWTLRGLPDAVAVTVTTTTVVSTPTPETAGSKTRLEDIPDFVAMRPRTQRTVIKYIGRTLGALRRADITLQDKTMYDGPKAGMKAGVYLKKYSNAPPRRLHDSGPSTAADLGMFLAKWGEK